MSCGVDPPQEERWRKVAPPLFFRSQEKKRTIANAYSADKINFRDSEEMSHSSNGVSSSGHSSSPRCPRRVVLLSDGEYSEAEQILQEYHGAEVSGNRLHAEVRRLASEHQGRYVAAEWLGPLGWTRFLWCRRESSGV